MPMDRSILLILPSQHAREALSAENFARFEPLGLAYIAASTPEHWDVQILDESVDSIDSLERFSIVGISTTTRTVPRAYQIALEARAQGCYTVAGGIHASMRPKEALRYFDTVIIGEGELLWPVFIKDYEMGRQKRLYKAEFRPEMDDLPFPNRRLMGAHYPVGSIQTSRGCPFDCYFCSVTVFNGKRCRYRSPELVLEELAGIPQKHIFFVDDNLIGCSQRTYDRAKRIFRGMIKRKLKKKYMAQTTINFGFDDELIELASESGCRAVFIGIESIETKILESMNKSINIKAQVSRYQSLLRRIQEKGIAVVGAITLGNDGESETIFEDTTRFVENSGLNSVQFTLTTPLPGTRLFEQLAHEDRIIFNNYPDDWVHYSLGSLVFQPKDKTPTEIAHKWKRLIDRSYSRTQILRRDLITLARTKRLSSVYLAHRLNKAYREAYRSSLYYNDPPLNAFARHSENREYLKPRQEDQVELASRGIQEAHER